MYLFWQIQININSLKNKFDMLSKLIKGSVNVFRISETKLDDGFPEGHFFIDGYHTLFKFDLNGDSVGNLLEVCDDKSSKINMNKRKELINYYYNSHKNYICGNLEVVTKALDVHYPIYEVLFFSKISRQVLNSRHSHNAFL